jgi:putative transposase
MESPSRKPIAWYNDEHRHSGIGLLTPEAVHLGLADEITKRRSDVLASAYAAHPERFVHSRPQPLAVSQNVWINRPDDMP